MSAFLPTDPVIWIQTGVQLLVTGSLYSLIALGLTLIFSIMRIINFAHAQMYMLGAFALYYFYQTGGMPYALAVALTAVAVGIFGMVVERSVIRPVVDDPLRSMVATLGLLLLLDGSAILAFGAREKFVTPPVNSMVSVPGGSFILVQSLIAVSLSLALVGLLAILLKFTRLGRNLRAASQDREGARLQGIHVRRMNTIGFALGSALAAAAAALILPLTSVLDPSIGNVLLPKMFIILILGGLGSIFGAVAGAFTLAAVETIGFTMAGEWAVLAAYVGIAVIILVRPRGLLSVQAREA